MAAQLCLCRGPLHGSRRLSSRRKGCCPPAALWRTGSSTTGSSWRSAFVPCWRAPTSAPRSASSRASGRTSHRHRCCHRHRRHHHGQRAERRCFAMKLFWESQAISENVGTSPKRSRTLSEGHRDRPLPPLEGSSASTQDPSSGASSAEFLAVRSPQRAASIPSGLRKSGRVCEQQALGRESCGRPELCLPNGPGEVRDLARPDAICWPTIVPERGQRREVSRKAGRRSPRPSPGSRRACHFFAESGPKFGRTWGRVGLRRRPSNFANISGEPAEFGWNSSKFGATSTGISQSCPRIAQHVADLTWPISIQVRLSLAIFRPALAQSWPKSGHMGRRRHLCFNGESPWAGGACGDEVLKIIPRHAGFCTCSRIPRTCHLGAAHLLPISAKCGTTLL